MTKIYINNKEYEVNSKKNLLEVCLSLGFDIPYFCYHPSLCSVGACRLCAVKRFANENDTKGRIIMSCMEPVQEGMIISTDDEEALKFRASVIESLMTNHPHDCPVCDEGGECHLQDMTVMSGHTYRRYEFKKRTYRNQNLGPFINHEMNRCIQCYRCVRYYKDYAGGKDLDVFGSRNNVYFGRFEDGKLESEFSGNLAEVCPTGVFTDKTLKKHYTRKWDMTNSPSVCTHCSLGCNIFISQRYGTLRRVLNRYNPEINGYFICDRGRFGYDFVNSEKRIKEILYRNNKKGEYQAIDKAELTEHLKELLSQSNNIIGIGSSRASIESNYVLKELVGKDNFYTGTCQTEHNLTKQILEIIKTTPAHIPSLKEIEKYDAVLILGEDLTNTAPMAALSVRQTVRQKPLEKATEANIPLWNDQAVRNLIRDEKGPLYIATPFETKLDDAATDTYRAAPEDIARLGFAVAHILNNNSPAVKDISEEILQKAKAIAESLKNAKKPLIISGLFSQSTDIINAASNIVSSLVTINKETGLFYTLAEANSIGLFMLGGKPIDNLLNAAQKNPIDCVIIIENDFYKHGYNDDIINLLGDCKAIVSLGHTENSTTLRSDYIIPTTTFAESDGTFINNEGRAQRYYNAFPSNGPEIQESWKWLKEMIDLTDKKPEHDFKTLDELNDAISKSISEFYELRKVAPSADYKLNNMKFARQTSRFTGRTAMNSNINVSEKGAPQDTETPLAFSMEGNNGKSDNSMASFYWSPGWNSVQSLNKYQRELGELLNDDVSGIKLLPYNSDAEIKFFSTVPDKFIPAKDKFKVIEIINIFGSEFLSSNSPSIIEASPEEFALINSSDAAANGIQENEFISIAIKNNIYRVKTKIKNNTPSGIIGLFLRADITGIIELPDWGKISKLNQL